MSFESEMMRGRVSSLLYEVTSRVFTLNVVMVRREAASVGKLLVNASDASMMLVRA
jgi:hypothetical protein